MPEFQAIPATPPTDSMRIGMSVPQEVNRGGQLSSFSPRPTVVLRATLAPGSRVRFHLLVTTRKHPSSGPWEAVTWNDGSHRGTQAIVLENTTSEARAMEQSVPLSFSTTVGPIFYSTVGLVWERSVPSDTASVDYELTAQQLGELGS